MENTLRVADEVWIAVASLHQRYPDREDFTIREIITQAERANLTGTRPIRPGVQVHAYLHCVANKPPNPGRYRMLFETGRSRRRLFRPTDPYHLSRDGAKEIPKREQIPVDQRSLIDWYNRKYATTTPTEIQDPVLALRGLGKELWADENADAFVRRQREAWQ